MEFFGYDGKKVILGVVKNNVAEDGNYSDEIGLRGFDLNLSEKYR